jgi:hypothetical protein
MLQNLKNYAIDEECPKSAQGKEPRRMQCLLERTKRAKAFRTIWYHPCILVNKVELDIEKNPSNTTKGNLWLHMATSFEPTIGSSSGQRLNNNENERYMKNTRALILI